MHTFLVLYGADNEMATFEADDAAHAAEQFVDWAPVSPSPEDNRNAINSIMMCLEVESWDNPDRPTIYATSSDGSFFPADDLKLKVVPADLTDPDDIERFLTGA